MSKLWLPFALLTLSVTVAHASGSPVRFPLMTYWSHNLTRYPNFPVPGSLTRTGRRQDNPVFRAELRDINVLAYAFLKVNSSGSIYFSRPSVDLSAADRRGFCSEYPRSCPNAARAAEGSFRAFAKLQNSRGTLEKIISIGGANSQKTMDHALDHPAAFVRSVLALVLAYHLSGVDLDFEPDSFFFGPQGKQFVAVTSALRSALGPQAFISIELPLDWETLRSVDCAGTSGCAHNLAALARVAYLSLMGYAIHLPSYPGPALTANDSNLFPDPNEPLRAGFDHVSDVQAIDYLTFLGVAPNRILLGFPAIITTYYGVTHPGAHFGLYQSFVRSLQDRQHPVSRYRDVPSRLKSGFIIHYLRTNHFISATFAYDRRLGEWMSFDDPASVAAKAHYVTTHHLGGMMMWEIGDDAPTGSHWSLLTAAHHALSESRSKRARP